RDFLHFARGPDRHRELATPLQHDQAPRLNRIQATSTRGVRARIRRVAGCATQTGSAGHAGETANLKLTFHLDHSAGADHSSSGRLMEKADSMLSASEKPTCYEVPHGLACGDSARTDSRRH